MSRLLHRSIAIALVAGLLLPAALIAHVFLRDSEPADGARLTAAPEMIRLAFSQRTELALTRIVLADSAGAEIALGSPQRDPSDTAGVVAAIEQPLSAGTYTVAWRTAAPDGHVVDGRFAFAVAPAQDPAAEAPIRPHELVGLEPPRAAASARARIVNRWVEFMALLTVIGSVTFILAVLPRTGWPEELTTRVADGARRFGMGSLLLLAAAMMTRVAAEAMVAFSGDENFGLRSMWTLVTQTRWGTGWSLGAAGAALLAAGLLIARRARAGWFVAVPGIVLLAASPALTGHAVAATSWPRVAVASDVAHVLGAGVWLGTLLVIVLAAIPPLISRADTGRISDGAGESLLRAFHLVALQGVILVVLSGLVSAALRLGALDALWTTPYGQILLLKLGGVALIAGLGMYHWRRVVPAAWTGDTAFGFRRSALAELAIATIVLALTAILVATPPPAGS